MGVSHLSCGYGTVSFKHAQVKTFVFLREGPVKLKIYTTQYFPETSEGIAKFKPSYFLGWPMDELD